MDDAKKLIHWALNLKSEYEVKISNFDWTKRFSFSQSDFHFQFKYLDKQYDGRGLDETSEIALVKAIIEAIERTILIKYNIENSNGIAAHFNSDVAKENALCELIERDVFMCNYLYPASGVLEINKNQLPDSIKQTMERFEKENVQIRFYEMGTILERTVVLALANGFYRSNPFGCVVGLGCNQSKEQSIRAAFSEAARNTATYIDSNYCFEWLQPENQFFNDDFQNFSILAHNKMSLTKTYGEWLWNYFLDKTKYPVINHDIQLREIEFQTLNLDSTFKDLNIQIVHAKSNSMQNLFFHKTNLKKVNLNRIRRYANKSILFEELNLRTHPVS